MSLTKKPSNKGKKLKSPGPADYSLKPLFGATDHDFTKMKLPAWSIGGPASRFPMPEFKSPGPARGKADITNLNRFGDKPKFAKTITAREFYDKKDVVPGPANHNVHRIPIETYKGEKGPAFTMQESKEPQFYEKKPAPPDTDFQNLNIYKDRKPAYRIGEYDNILKILGRPDGPASSYPGGIQKDHVMTKPPEYSLGQQLQPPKREKNGVFDVLSAHNPFPKPPHFPFGVKYYDSTYVPFVPDDNWCC